MGTSPPRYTCHGKPIWVGTHSQVFMARSVATGRVVAVKRPVEAPDWEQRMKIEIEMLCALDHPNIVRLLDVEAPNNMIFEYAPTDLHRRIHFGPLAVDEVRRMMHDIFSGLAYLHARGVIHRDMKPENILITTTGALQIADFGLAVFATESDCSVHVASVPYRAPELVLGDRLYNNKVDLWACGCILYELIKRTRLFKSVYPDELLPEMVKTLGTPVDLCDMAPGENWPGLSNLPYYADLVVLKTVKRRLRPLLPDRYTLDAHMLLSSLLTYYKNARPSANQCLSHLFLRCNTRTEWCA